MKSKQMDQQVIRSLIQNWNWETLSTPDWLSRMIEILIKIDEHNKLFLNDNLHPLDTKTRDKLDELSGI